MAAGMPNVYALCVNGLSVAAGLDLCRRLRGGAGGTAAAAPPGSLHHRLTRTLPRQLCRPAASARSPVPSPGALLLCYLPPAPSAPSGPGGGKAAAAAAAARELADG